ncbi:MAG: hypothetical protein II651_04080 [Selenomonas sp.]|nr:hypothetical protein [Selenomonas sp.]
MNLQTEGYGNCRSWRAMTERYQEGRIRAVGACNYGSDRLVETEGKIKEGGKRICC